MNSYLRFLFTKMFLELENKEDKNKVYSSIFEQNTTPNEDGTCSCSIEQLYYGAGCTCGGE